MIAFDNSYAQLPETFYARVQPDTVPAPSLVCINHRLCKELDVSVTWLASPAGLAMLSGNALPDSAEPLAMVYAGHQFGNWNPQLGDGRAILLGEVFDRNGIRRDVQLKGSGRTPFSRGGDGKATLGAVLREYIVSEGMFALGIPTTRALACVTTGETIFREGPVPGAILTRVAQSHVRIGTFEYFRAQNDIASLRRLAHYVIERHYPKAAFAKNPHRELLASVVERLAELIARWMLLGFIHGVMNTDNMQVVGETIDYGPCAFIDNFHPNRVFSSIDRHGRYAWNQQPTIGKWNVARLGDALLPLLAPKQEEAIRMVEEALPRFDDAFNAAFAAGFRRKLGLLEEDESDTTLMETTISALTDGDVDFTLFFRHLTRIAQGEEENSLLDLFSPRDTGKNWLTTWRQRIAKESASSDIRAGVMQGVNPIYIPRNHRVEEAIEHAVRGDFEPFHRLVRVLSNPYEEQPDNVEYELAPRLDQRVHETFCNT